MFRFCSVNIVYLFFSFFWFWKRFRCCLFSGLIMMYRDLLFRLICLYERLVLLIWLIKFVGILYILIYVNWGRLFRRCLMLCLFVMGMYNCLFNLIVNRKIFGMYWYLCLIYMKVINYLENLMWIWKVFVYFDIVFNIILGFYEKIKLL